MTCTSLLCTIFPHAVTLGNGKSSSFVPTIGNLGGVVPYEIGVGFIVCVFSSCTSSAHDSVIYLSW